MLYVEREEERIRKLTVEQVNAAVRKYLLAERLYVVMAGEE